MAPRLEQPQQRRIFQEAHKEELYYSKHQPSHSSLLNRDMVGF